MFTELFGPYGTYGVLFFVAGLLFLRLFLALRRVGLSRTAVWYIFLTMAPWVIYLVLWVGLSLESTELFASRRSGLGSDPLLSPILFVRETITLFPDCRGLVFLYAGLLVGVWACFALRAREYKRRLLRGEGAEAQGHRDGLTPSSR